MPDSEDEFFGFAIVLGPRLVTILPPDTEARECLLASGDGFVNGNRQEGIGRSGLYVDIENLQSEGQSMVQRLIENWPDKVPTATRLTLYVRADQTELWRLWATSQFANMEVVVHGTQHISMSATKNSADIAIATSAMADLPLKRVSQVVVAEDQPGPAINQKIQVGPV